MPDAQWIGPSPAQLSVESDANFQKAMLGMAEMLGEMTKQKQMQETAKAVAKQKADEDDIKNYQTILDTMIKNSSTGSIAEVAKTPEGQQVITGLYEKMKMPKEVIPSIVSQYANNLYTPDQTHQALIAKHTADILAATGAEVGPRGQAAGEASPQGRAGPSQVAQGVGPEQGGVSPTGVPLVPSQAPGSLGTVMPSVAGGAVAPTAVGAAGQVPFAPGAATGVSPAMPTYVMKALSGEGERAEGTVAGEAGQEPKERRKAQVAQAQVKAQAMTEANKDAQAVVRANPNATSDALKIMTDPNGPYVVSKMLEKNPNEYYRDTDVNHIRKYNAEIEQALALARKAGLEGDEMIINLKTLAEKNKAGITLDKATAYDHLMSGAAATINAKLSSVYMQMNNAMLNDAIKGAQDFGSQANTAYQKLKEPTANDLPNLNALVDLANDRYHQANRIATTMQLSQGGKKEDTPQFMDVPYYKFTKKQGIVGGFQSAIQGAVFGEGEVPGSISRDTSRTTVTPQAGAQGVGASQAGRVTTGARSVTPTLPSDDAVEKALREAGFTQ